MWSGRYYPYDYDTVVSLSWVVAFLSFYSARRTNLVVSAFGWSVNKKNIFLGSPRCIHSVCELDTVGICWHCTSDDVYYCDNIWHLKCFSVDSRPSVQWSRPKCQHCVSQFQLPPQRVWFPRVGYSVVEWSTQLVWQLWLGGSDHSSALGTTAYQFIWWRPKQGMLQACVFCCFYVFSWSYLLT